MYPQNEAEMGEKDILRGFGTYIGHGTAVQRAWGAAWTKAAWIVQGGLNALVGAESPTHQLTV